MDDLIPAFNAIHPATTPLKKSRCLYFNFDSKNSPQSHVIHAAFHPYGDLDEYQDSKNFPILH